MEGVLQKANIQCSYVNLKTAIQTATNRWIYSLIKCYPEDLSEFVEDVVKREFNFDSDATYSLKNCNAVALINCPHAKITIGQLTVNGKIKKSENYNIEFWFNKSRVKQNPEENFVNVFHKDQYSLDPNDVPDRRSNTSSKFLETMASFDDGSKEFLEVAVLKKAKNRKKLSELIFREERNKELRDAFVGRVIVPLSKAIEFNRKQHSWSLVLGGVSIGAIELAFDFINQDMISAHELFISQISSKVLENFNELWQLNAAVDLRRPSILPSPQAQSTGDDLYGTNQHPLTCWVEATLFGVTEHLPVDEEQKEHLENV